jgi:hypothetical protein
MLDLIKNTMDRMALEQQIRDKARIIIPDECRTWIQMNMRLETESLANNYMRNNFLRFFRQEISENKEVTGFIGQHLESVAGKVRETAEKEIHQIVDHSTEMNPIFEKHLQILATRNTKQLDDMTSTAKTHQRSLEIALKDNDDLRKRVLDLERMNDRMALFNGLTFVGGVVLMAKLMLSKRF